MPATDVRRPAPSVAPRAAPPRGNVRRRRTLRLREALVTLLLVVLPCAPAFGQDGAAEAGSSEAGRASEVGETGESGDSGESNESNESGESGEARLTASSLDDAIARLTVLPAGEQTFDLLTGVTTLPAGGTVVDQETGLRLVADHIRYVEGEYIEARGARAETEAGTLTATSLRIDVPTLTAHATEGIAFERPGLRFEATSAEYAFADSLVRFDRPTGQDPGIEAAALLLAVDSGDALLLGPYRYQQGLFTLSDDRADAALQLRPVAAEDGTPGYRAANEVDPDLWARVAPLR